MQLLKHVDVVDCDCLNWGLGVKRCLRGNMGNQTSLQSHLGLFQDVSSVCSSTCFFCLSVDYICFYVLSLPLVCCPQVHNGASMNIEDVEASRCTRRDLFDLFDLSPIHHLITASHYECVKPNT